MVNVMLDSISNPNRMIKQNILNIKNDQILLDEVLNFYFFMKSAYRFYKNDGCDLAQLQIEI